MYIYTHTELCAQIRQDSPFGQGGSECVDGESPGGRIVQKNHAGAQQESVVVMVLVIMVMLKILVMVGYQ